MDPHSKIGNNNFDALLRAPVKIVGRDGRTYRIKPMTSSFARRRVDVLVRLHNLIPYVEWSPSDLLADQDDRGRPYSGKWALSLAVTNGNAVVGFLIAYLRDLDERHPMRSVYIHRLAMAPKHQRNLVGVQLVSFAVALYFDALPWLLSVTVQTNDEKKNSHVIGLYRSVGFRRAYPVKYPDKLDVLMELNRDSHLSYGTLIPRHRNLVVPNASHQTQSSPNFFSSPHDSHAPIVYFGTSSREKLQQYRFLARCFGIELQRLHTTISLSEPQPEGEGREAELAIVAGPLKLFSRFAALGRKYPIMVEDTMLFIEHFNLDFDRRPLLPGADTKRWWRALGADGLLRVLATSNRRRATYVCQIGLNTAPGEYHYVREELSGSIARSVRATIAAEENFPYTNATFFHSIFVPNSSTKTLAEMDSRDFLAFDYRRRCFAQVADRICQRATPSPQLTLFREMLD